MEIDTNGKFNMWGDFITFDGIYNFKNLRSVIDKKFNLKRVVQLYRGDPLSAQMDLEAFIVFQVEQILLYFLLTLTLIEKFLQKFLFIWGQCET